MAANIDELGRSNGKIVLAGDSAGGHLATVTCLALDPEIRRHVAGEIIIYPVTDHYESAFGSYTEKARVANLASSMMRWFWDSYLASNHSISQNEATMPLRASNLSSLPATFLVTAENDPLRDEGIAYANKLRDSGVAIQYRHFENAAHGFACSEGPTEVFDAFMCELVKWLHELEARV